MSEGGAARTGWLSSWIFLLLANEGLFKGISLSWYFNRRKLAQRSYLEIKPDGVCFVETASRMTHRMLQQAAGGTLLEKDVKKEYFLTFTYHIRSIDSIIKRRDGSLIITGKLDRESFNEAQSMLHGTNQEGNKIQTVDQCVIPAYFEDMDQIESKLREMIR